MSKTFLLSACVFLFLGMQAKKGTKDEDMILTGMITYAALAIKKEAGKKRCTTRLYPYSKPLRISDLKDDEYFHRRFRFRKVHLVRFMILIGLFDEDNLEYKRIVLDSERHCIRFRATFLLCGHSNVDFSGSYGKPLLLCNHDEGVWHD